MAGFRDLLCRKKGFEHISRYVTGLIRSPNKTLQGIYALHVWNHNQPSRGAMHEAVFEAAWDAQERIKRHRARVVHDHRGAGERSSAWTGRRRIMSEAPTSLASTWRMILYRAARRGVKPSSPQ
jgi:hypothetical protein